MNREIKFRAWDDYPSFGESKQMYYDVIVGRGVVICTLDEEEFAENNLEPIYMTMDNSVANFILMQYTGLKDKNGVEIYEGDIISVPYVTPLGTLTEEEDYKAEVFYANGCFVFRDGHAQVVTHQLSEWCKRSNKRYVSNVGEVSDLLDETLLIVKGNIYQHPHLLNQ